MAEDYHLTGPDEFGDFTITTSKGGLAVAAVVNGEMWRMGGQWEQHVARATLFAAAGKMVAALEMVERKWVRADGLPFADGVIPAIDAVREALSAAGGKPSLNVALASAADRPVRYETPGVSCGKGHINHLPVSLWDCPICTEEKNAEINRLRDTLRDILSFPSMVHPRDGDHDSYERVVNTARALLDGREWNEVPG